MSPKICENCGDVFEPWVDVYDDAQDMCKYCTMREEEEYLQCQLFDREFGDN